MENTPDEETNLSLSKRSGGLNSSEVGVELVGMIVCGISDSISVENDDDDNGEGDDERTRPLFRELFPVMLAFLIAGFLVPLRWLERITRKLLFFGQDASVTWGAAGSRVTASAGWAVVVNLSGDVAAPKASCPPESLAEKYELNLWSKYSLRNEPDSWLDSGYTSSINQSINQPIHQSIN